MLAFHHRRPLLTRTGATFIALCLGTAALARENDAYDRLVAATTSPTISDLVFERDMKIGFDQGLRMDPELVAEDEACPGLIVGLTEAVRPIMRESHEEGYGRYREKLEMALREGLDPAEAASAADFYETDLAQRFLATFIKQSVADSALDEVMGDEAREQEEVPDITAKAQAADKRASVLRTMAALGPDEFQAVVDQLSNAPWFASYNRLSPRINAFQLEMANEELTPEQDTRFNTAIEDFMMAHYEQCEVPDEPEE